MSANFDQHLTCADCNHNFLWSAREQEFYREKGLQPPKRCKDCARARKERRDGRAEGRGGKPFYLKLEPRRSYIKLRSECSTSASSSPLLRTSIIYPVRTLRA